MRPFRKHDETEFKKLVDWQRQMKTKGANKEKPERQMCIRDSLRLSQHYYKE